MKKLLIILFMCALMPCAVIEAKTTSEVSDAVSAAQSVTIAPLFDGISLYEVKYNEKSNIVTISLMNHWNKKVKAGSEEQLTEYAKWILSECGKGYKAACVGESGEGDPEAYKAIYKVLDSANTCGAKLSVILIDETTKKQICDKAKIQFGPNEIRNILNDYR